MGGPHARNPRPVFRPLEPAGEFGPDAAAEHAAAFEARPLASDDQHDAKVLFRRVGDEPCHRPFRGNQCRAVQIELGFRHALALCQGTVDVAIEDLRHGRRHLRRPDRGEGFFRLL